MGWFKFSWCESLHWLFSKNLEYLSTRSILDSSDLSELQILGSYLYPQSTHKTRLEQESQPATETHNAASEGTRRLYILYVTTQFNPWWWGRTHITSSKGSHCVKNWTRDPIYDFKKCGSFYRDPLLGLVSGTTAPFWTQASLWAHVHVPSLGTRQHSLLWSLWPHCMSTSPYTQ